MTQKTQLKKILIYPERRKLRSKGLQERKHWSETNNKSKIRIIPKETS